MYTEEPKREINWKNIIKKGLLVLIIATTIFLIIWLFTRNSSNSVSTDNNTQTYSEKFIENYRYFRDTAKNYYLTTKLPENGESLKFTLQELIDKKVILPFDYTETETCNTKTSYVTLKNNDGTYTLTTTLVCGTEIATTKEELGCNDLCKELKDCNCTEDLTEYEYKQPYTVTETTYTCPTGYTKTGEGENTKCTKESETINATKNVSYTCPEGYTKTGEGENTKCTKESTDTIDATKNVTYTCPKDYKLEGTKCYKTSSESYNASYTITYTCPSGYTKSGNGEKTICTKPITLVEDATENVTYTCPSGYTKNGTKCYKTTTSKYKANVTYTCPEGFTKSGTGENTTCTKTTTSTENATENVTYTCPSDYSLISNICVKTEHKNFSYGSKYTNNDGAICTGGQLTNGKYYYQCKIEGTKNTTYTCPADYTQNDSTCTKTNVEVVDATPNYSCNNTSDTLDNGYCYTIITDKKDATKNVSYTCPNGYTLDGKTCTKPSSVIKMPTISKNYYCNTGDTLINDKCYTNVTDSKNTTENITYTCPSNYMLSENKCILNTNDELKANKNITYTCASDYTKIGVGAESKCVKYETVKATASKKSTTKYRYQWSTLTSIEGWTKTGNTR